MLVNMNVRVLGNGAVFVGYNEEGKAKDAAFVGWDEFIKWLEVKKDAGELASKPYHPGAKND